MIVDKIERLGTYRCLGANFANAVHFIQGLDIATLKEQDFVVDGEKVYAFSKHFPLKSTNDAVFEAHRRYADIQLVLDGRESIYVCDTGSLELQIPYNEQKDIAFYHDAERCTHVELLPGEFGIFFPWDAHKPCCVSGHCDTSYKLVVKVLI